MNKTIKSDNANALEELKTKAGYLRAAQEDMVKANAYFRKNCTMRDFENLSDEEADKFDNKIQNAYSWQKKPYPDYLLQNNSQNLRSTELRIKLLEQEANAAPKEYDTEKFGFKVVENKEDMRLQLFFEDKPEEDIREKIKLRGFKWAPSKGCWQRLLNSNARCSLDGLLRSLERQQQTVAEMC